MKTNIYRLFSYVDKDTYDCFHKKAKGKGLSSSVLLRQVVDGYLHQRESLLNLDDIQRAIKAMIPAIVLGLVATSSMKNKSQETLDKLCKGLLKQWREEYNRGPMKED